jgi:hypothetical protein
MKISLLPPTTSIISSALIAIVKAGKTYKIPFANFLANYYTKSEVNAQIENVVAGGIPWKEKVYDNRSIAEGGSDTITHNLANENFNYWCLKWNGAKYIKMQTPIAESNRTANSLTLTSGMPIDKYKVVIFG